MFSSISWRPETGDGSISPLATRAAIDSSGASPLSIARPSSPAQPA